MKWKWAGPYKSGITQSMIGKYLQDPFCFVLYYGLGLEEQTVLNQNLLWGNMFHKGLEHVLPEPERVTSLPEIKRARLLDVLAEEERRYLNIDATTLHSVRLMLDLYPDKYKTNYSIATEQEFAVDHRTKNHLIKLKGKMDGVGTRVSSHLTDTNYLHDAATIMIEHKSKESYDRHLFRSEIHLDLQLNIYLYALNQSVSCDTVVYDNIKIPELQWNCPARQAGERNKAYIERLYLKHHYGDYPVSQKSFLWVDQYIFKHSMEKIQLMFAETINPIIDAICYMYEYTLSDSFDPMNPDCYNHMFHKKPLRVFDPARTSKFKKDYWSYLVGNTNFSDLIPVDQFFKELSQDYQ
jgi:hypothetical protein